VQQTPTKHLLNLAGPTGHPKICDTVSGFGQVATSFIYHNMELNHTNQEGKDLKKETTRNQGLTRSNQK